MALSTLRMAAMRTSRYGSLFTQQTSIIYRGSYPMATSAHDQMQAFWKKNQSLGRPVSPWIIYMPHLPMLTSLCHRATGIVMGVSLYAIAIGVFLAPGDFTSYLHTLQGWNISPFLLMPAKSIVAFPLVYHYINGIRHLYWDYKSGYELSTQYKTGWSIVAITTSLAALLGGLSYLI